ncbi:glycosyltransferase [Oceanobacillus sp. J11TS1]|uniref:glycosyltransferase n=1 Tax=Oceanobacillus sp. J11TS1 TaxID=2807191 RepID=UPI001B039450|nr:glycosyltransferase [Oceanobacillus sp. J11TS1]GIO23426.1 hypothetical protein J11TS1_20070 [Oceanobacillus sp. J11TS1]
MLRKTRKIVIDIIDWFLYKFLTTKQKENIANIFTQKQKQAIKQVIKPGKKQAQVKKIERIKYRLNNLGFSKKALEDLHKMFQQEDNPYLKRLAAWELAVYYANQYSAKTARKSLEFIPEAIKNTKDKDLKRRAAILKAENLETINHMKEAKEVIIKSLASNRHADLYLAAANLESSIYKKEEWLNKIFDLYGIANIKIMCDCATYYDGIRSQLDRVEFIKQINMPKVTVIIPVYNAEKTITVALESILSQSWTNLEVLVVDDCSTDNTKKVVAEYVKKDQRVKLLQTEVNSGAYVARNIALKIATGEYVTINDGDDWSHPEKIKIQVEHLISHPHIIGNFSQQARVTEELKFYRRGKPGIYIFPNMSSFMFRRQSVMKELGFWDSVRFAGDSEFVKRVKLVFGEKSVVQLKTAPLAFQRQSESSLTGNSVFGFPGYFMGARKEYAEAHEYFHLTTEKYKYEFPQVHRPFPVPEPMLPNKGKSEESRHFDVILASEFRLLGGTNMSNIEEIKAQKKFGLRTGLIQMNRYDLNSVKVINPEVRKLIDGDQVQMLSYGEKVTCDLLIIRHPPILEEWQKYLPQVKAKNVHVIVNQPPRREYSTKGERLYDIRHCADHLGEYFGNRGIWHPIGPRIRKILNEHHQEELQSIQLAEKDWVNIINMDEWKREIRPHNEKTIIGRHSRDQYVKWPNDRTELLTIYPDSNKCEIYVMGGAKSAKKVLGEIPSNWRIYDFGELKAKDFLKKLDVFVYYTHPDWVEAFGRVIFEAMAVGVPVIIPPVYKDLFNEAAIYAEPHEVKEKVNLLIKKPHFYETQVKKAQEYVENKFGYTVHASRLEVFRK